MHPAAALTQRKDRSQLPLFLSDCMTSSRSLFYSRLPFWVLCALILITASQIVIFRVVCAQVIWPRRLVPFDVLFRPNHEALSKHAFYLFPAPQSVIFSLFEREREASGGFIYRPYSGKSSGITNNDALRECGRRWCEVSGSHATLAPGQTMNRSRGSSPEKLLTKTCTFNILRLVQTSPPPPHYC